MKMIKYNHWGRTAPTVVPVAQPAAGHGHTSVLRCASPDEGSTLNP
ncbi:MAG TPA: hypothetical protein PKI20_21910 [Verrucomicrobiota bacterium]|nr:hypothetical protein [Verrucomicrobiota bacterium]HQL80483.1 hypothetical protein [Verrucomicrobiota bacterium]